MNRVLRFPPKVFGTAGGKSTSRRCSGVRLFDRLAATPAVLGNPTVIPGVGVTHVSYPVQKA